MLFLVGSWRSSERIGRQPCARFNDAIVTCADQSQAVAISVAFATHLVAITWRSAETLYAHSTYFAYVQYAAGFAVSLMQLLRFLHKNRSDHFIHKGFRNFCKI